MDERIKNLNLVEILKDFPEGTKLYSPLYGDVELVKVHSGWDYPIEVKLGNNTLDNFTMDGRIFIEHDGECMLFPSREERDWSKLKDKLVESKFKDGDSVPNKFDPKTFQPFDRVLVRRDSGNYNVWFPDFVSDSPNDTNNKTLCMCIMEDIAMVIPYNEETKHLVGTKEEAPEYYRYWEE